MKRSTLLPLLGIVLFAVLGFGAARVFAQPAPPVLVSPTDGASITLPTFTWLASVGAWQYEIQVDNDQTFASPVWSARTRALSITPVDALQHGLLWWRVRAIDASDHAGSWSAAWSFTKHIAGPAPVSPPDGSRQISPILSWQSSPGAVRYRVEVDDSSAFTSINRSEETSGLSTALAGWSGLTTEVWWWRVRGVDAGGHNAGAGPAWRFEKFVPAPVLSLPTDGATLADPNLRWEPVEGAARYYVQVDDSSAFSSPNWSVTTANTAATIDRSLSSRAYSWRVRGQSDESGGGFLGDPSPTRSFVLVAPAPCGEPNLALVSPANGAVLDKVEPFVWKCLPNATRYRLLVYRATLGQFTYADTPYTSYTPGDAFPNDSYSWRVEAYNDSTLIGTSETRQLTLTAAFDLVQPADAALVTGDPVFSWRSLTGATTYKLSLYQDGTQIATASSERENVVITGLKNGAYTWDVTAYGGSALLARSTSTRGFTKNTVFDLTSPPSGSIHATAPNFEWQPRPDADHYRILVFKDGVIYTYAMTDYTAYTPYHHAAGSKDALPDGSYTWRVEAYDADSKLLDQSISTWSFTIGQGATPTPTPTPTATPGSACPDAHTYSADADFDQGLLMNVNHTAPNNDQLQLYPKVTPLNYIWIALSGRGTVVKVNTETGAILGEYRSAPEGRSRNPSRTTVDLDGNVWVGNRDESSGGRGSVVHIGLKENFQCVDRNGNGAIDTSAGLGDVKPWPNTGGADNNGGVSTAQDECIIDYLRVNGTAVRTVAVDAHNDVWIGGYDNRVHDLIDGDTNAVLKTIYPDCGGYGGLVDSRGTLWSARGPGDALLRYDPATGASKCVNVTNNYGVAVDASGVVWNSQWSNNTVTRIDPTGNVLGSYSTGGTMARGVAVTADNDVWIANSGTHTVARLSNTGALLATIKVGFTPTGVAVDAAGKVWVTNYDSNSAMRINPATNAVDLTVNLGDGARPYNYSDMTGAVILSSPPQGKWVVVFDGGAAGRAWGTVSWHGSEPAGTKLAARVRSADETGKLGDQAWVEVTNGVAFSNVPFGRYLQIEVTFSGTDAGATPVLYDLTVAVTCGNAQPMLYIDPPSATTAVSGTLTLDVRVRNVTNLYGVQLNLSFDPAKVEVVDATPGGDVNVQPGDFLQPGAVIYSNYVDNGTGLIDYVQTREGELPGVTGSGLLARITFHGKGAGTSPVRFTLHKLSDPLSVPIAHDYADGEVVVLGAGSLSGKVILERRVNFPNSNAGATVQAGGQSVVTGADGRYSFTGVPGGPQQIKITHPSYLPTWRTVEVSPGGSVTAPDVTLLGGDCTSGQGKVEGADAVAMGLAWEGRPTDARWNGRCDVRDDQVIDVYDFTAVKYNWLKAAPGAWPGEGAVAATAEEDDAANAPHEERVLVPAVSATSVSVQPASMGLSRNAEAIVEIRANEVNDLYGAGFTLEFNPAVLAVLDSNPDQAGVQIEPGGWLSPGLEVINAGENAYGRVQYFVTQRYPATPKSGSGVIARVHFKAISAGVTGLHFTTAQLVDRASKDIATTMLDGTIRVPGGLYLPLTRR